MKTLKIVFIGIIISVFCAGQAYSAPKGSNGKGNANNKENNGKGKAAKVNKGNNKSVSQTKGRSAIHKRQARRSSEADRRREERNRSSQRNLASGNNGNDLAFNNNRNNRGKSAKRNGEDRRNENAIRVHELLGSLDRARWSHNPHDTRGQGNMGKVDMLDPFGHDKDSDRKELYGNNGRPIRITEELIINLQEMISFDWQTENEYLPWYRRMVDYYANLLTNDSLTDAQISMYTYRAEQWQSVVDRYEAIETTRIFLRGDATIDYSINLDIPEGTRESTLLVTTSLVVSQSFDTVVREYNSETGIWEYRTVHYEAGQVIDEVQEETVVNADSSEYVFSYDPPGDLLLGNEWNSEGGYFDVVINVTDTSSESTITQTFNRSLYLYRDPYGKVEDSQTGQEIVGAKITVFTDDGSIVALDQASNPTASNPQMTDATGRFGFNLRADRKYYMVATAPGYEDYQSEVFTEQFHVIREDIKMVPEQEMMASNLN